MACGFLLGIALSAHIGLEEDYNPLHPNARIQCGSYISGVYFNSVERESFYAGFKYDLTEDISAEIGLVDGYDTKRETMPYGRILYKNYFIAPAYESSTDTMGLAAGIQFYLGE